MVVTTCEYSIYSYKQA